MSHRRAFLVFIEETRGVVAVSRSMNSDANCVVSRNSRTSHPQSYERLFHLTNQPGLLLPLRHERGKELAEELTKPRLERAIGVIYRPETELASHYFEAELSRQFDEYIWIDRTTAITPLPTGQIKGVPDTYPFGI